MPRQIQSISVTFANTGIVLKSSPDEIPLTAYMALVNVSTDRENSLSVRKGFTRLNDGLPESPVSAYSVRDINGRLWRYAVASNRLYVAPVEAPGDESVWPLSQGNSFLAVPGGTGMSSALDKRPIWASYTLIGLEYKPYVFLADGKVFLKHKAGDGNTPDLGAARRVGIPKPYPIESVELLDNAETIIEDFEDLSVWLDDNVTLSTETGHDGANQAMGIEMAASDDQVGGAVTATRGEGAYPAIIDLDPTDPDGIIEVWIKFENEEAALNCSEIILSFGLSETPGDTSTETRYEKAIKPSEFEAASQPGSGGRSETYGDAVPDANADVNYRNTRDLFDINDRFGPDLID